MSPLTKDLRINDVAQLLGVHRNTVRRWLRDGRLKGQTIEDVLVFVREREEVKRLEDWELIASVVNDLFRRVAELKRMIERG